VYVTGGSDRSGTGCRSTGDRKSATRYLPCDVDRLHSPHLHFAIHPTRHPTPPNLIQCKTPPWLPSPPPQHHPIAPSLHSHPAMQQTNARKRPPPPMPSVGAHSTAKRAPHLSVLLPSPPPTPLYLQATAPPGSSQQSVSIRGPDPGPSTWATGVAAPSPRSVSPELTMARNLLSLPDDVGPQKPYHSLSASDTRS
jgi:hypothetical protein